MSRQRDPGVPPANKAEYFKHIRYEVEMLAAVAELLASGLPQQMLSTALGKNIRAALPPSGNVRIVAITDKQFGKMHVVEGQKRVDAEEPPEQIVLL